MGFPGYFDRWNPNQKELVEAIVDAFEENDVVLAEAPTATGKTLVGGAASRVLGGGALYLAHTIQLQRQQLGTLPGCVTVTGRRNHPCLLPPLIGEPINADEADCPCELAIPGGCSYYDQWFEAMEARDVALNYAYMTRIVKARGIKVADGFGTTGKDRNIIPNPFIGRELMVCDEGHNLEGALLDADKVDVYLNSFVREGFYPPDTTDFRMWLEWAERIAPTLQQRYEDKRKAGTVVTDKVTADTFKDQRRIAGLIQTLDGIKDLAKLDKGSKDPVVFVGRRPHGWVIQPIWAWDRAAPLLFNHARKVLIMSATLGGPQLAAKLLGLKEGWQYIKTPHNIPVENRLVFYWPVSKMKYGMDDSEMMKQVVALANLAITKFPDSAGLVHTNSYKLAKYMYERMPLVAPELMSRLVLNAGGADRVATFEDFENNPGNRILLTPAATTGVDWGFLGWQMIPKVPYPDLSDEIAKLRFEYVDEHNYALGKEVYQNETAKTLVQACGRTPRSVSGRGVTVITDEAFWPLFKHIAPKAFPDWFRQAVTWHKT
jgi:Rad3-related DNA helicase